MAKRKKSKYKKTHLETWKCDDCEFEWSYQTIKCPLCSCDTMIKIL